MGISTQTCFVFLDLLLKKRRKDKMGKKKPTLMQRARMNPYANPMVMNHIINNGDIERSNLKRQQRDQGYNNHIKGLHRKCQKYEENLVSKDLERNLASSSSVTKSLNPEKNDPYADLMAMNHRLNEEIMRSKIENDKKVEGLERKCKDHEDQVKHLLGRNQAYEKKVMNLEQNIKKGIDRHLIAENRVLEEQVKSKNEEIHANNEVIKQHQEKEQFQINEINEMKEVVKNQSKKIVEQCIELESKDKTIKKLEDAKKDEREVIHSTEVRTKYIEVHTID